MPDIIEILVPASPTVVEVGVPGIQGPVGPPGPQGLPSDPMGSVIFVADGGGYPISPGVQGDLVMPYDFWIEDVTLLADQPGSIGFDIWCDAFAGFPPTAAHSICGASKPQILFGTKSRDTALTGWTTFIPEGAVLRFNVENATAISRCTLALKVSR